MSISSEQIRAARYEPTMYTFEGRVCKWARSRAAANADADMPGAERPSSRAYFLDCFANGSDYSHHC